MLAPLSFIKSASTEQSRGHFPLQFETRHGGWIYSVCGSVEQGGAGAAHVQLFSEVTTPFPSLMLPGSLLDLGLNENYFHIGAFGFRLNNKSSAIIW